MSWYPQENDRAMCACNLSAREPEILEICCPTNLPKSVSPRLMEKTVPKCKVERIIKTLFHWAPHEYSLPPSSAAWPTSSITNPPFVVKSPTMPFPTFLQSVSSFYLCPQVLYHLPYPANVPLKSSHRWTLLVVVDSILESPLLSKLTEAPTEHQIWLGEKV